MTMNSLLRTALSTPLVALLLTACSSVEEKPQPPPRAAAFKSVLWADDIKVALEKLNESKVSCEQVLPRLDERPVYNYLAFVDEDAIATHYGAKKHVSPVESKLRKMFNYRILKIERGGGEVRLFFLETIPYTREYLLEDKMSPNHAEAKSQLARVQIVFDPSLSPEQIGEKLRSDFIEFDSVGKPFQTRSGEVDVEYHPPVAASGASPARGATLVKTSAQVMADYRKAVTDKSIELMDAQVTKNDKNTSKSLDF